MRVGIALGSNLGDRVAHLRRAVKAVRLVAETPVLVSRVYETLPVDCPPDSPLFLNAAMEIGYSGDIQVLLEHLQSIEKVEGRASIRGQNSPRTVDLDILYADELIVKNPSLELPHPRIMSRLFVLLPLQDIAPDRKPPGSHITFSEAVKALESQKYNLIQDTID